jgi:hypothetical protein
MEQRHRCGSEKPNHRQLTASPGANAIVWLMARCSDKAIAAEAMVPVVSKAAVGPSQRRGQAGQAASPR